MHNLETAESSATLMGDASILTSSSFKGSGDVCIDSISDENLLLEDLESYWNDLNNRLTVSRMVSDSVIRGMVNAVVQEAAESISSKEAEITELHKRLQLYDPDAVSGGKSAFSPLILRMTSQVQYNCSDPFSDDARQLCSLNIAAEKHLQLLKSGIECMRRSNHCKMINLASGNSKFCCVHDQLKASDGLTQLDQSIDALGEILATIHERTSEMSSSFKDSLYEQQWKWKFQKEVDSIIIQAFMRELREHFDMELCRQKSLLDVHNNFWSKKVNELSSLCQELESISKSIFSIEPEHPFSHGSQDSFEEWSNNKRKDHLPHKMFRENAAADNSHEEENGFGSAEISEKAMPEVVDSSLLQHMSKEQLITHFQNEINKIKRQLESSLHEKTEELFRLKRQYLKEGGSLHCRRDKDIEALKKKVPEIVLKLDKVLLASKNFSALQDHHDRTCSYKQRMESILSENQCLCDLLVDKRKEVECLSSQVSHAANQMSNYSNIEANLLKKVNELKQEIEDVKTEAFITNQVDKCIMSELIHEVQCQMENLHMENMMIEESCGVILKGSVVEACSSMKPVMMYDEEMKILTQAISQKETTLDLEVQKTKELKQEVTSLSRLINEKESALSLEVKKSEKLNQEIISLLALIEEKNNFISEVESKLMQQKKQLDSFSEELNLWKDEANEREKLISEDKRESNLLKVRLDEALNQIHQSDAKVCELNQRLAIVSNDLKEAEKQKAILCDVIQQKQLEMSSVIVQVDEQREQLESIVIFVQELSKSVAAFESFVMWNIERRSSRLETLCDQCDALVKHIDILKRRELWYKKKLEIRISDLEKAEIEVDLLGDEVDALLNILEKIYLALDHYSPVLQHYPGVMEILKLVRRELKGND